MRCFRRLCLAGMMLALGACADPTEVVLFIDTTLGVPCLVDRIEITVQGAGEPMVREADPREGLSSLTVTRNESGSEFDVFVTGYRGTREYAMARATVAFASEERLSLPIVLDERCVGQICDASGGLQPFSAPVAAARPACDGISLQYVGATTRLEDFVDACSVAVPGFERLPAFADDEVQPTNETIQGALGNTFDFFFYGRPVDTLWISDDGYLSFSPDRPMANVSQAFVQDMTDPGLLKQGVAAFWDDLSSQNGEICAALIEGGQFDRLWVTWKNMCFAEACNQSDVLTFSVGLEENSNRIIVAYDRMESAALPEAARGSEAVMGIRGLDPLNGCGPSACSSAGVCSDGRTPCGFTQGFARTPQPPEEWPNRWLFQPQGTN